MLGLGRGRQGKDALVGIECLQDGIAIAKSEVCDGRRVVELCEFISTDLDQDVPVDALVGDKVAALGLKNLPCNWVIPQKDYSLLLIEAPSVPAAELQQAVRWRVKDLIAFPIEEAVVDVLPLPEGVSRKSKMVYVAVTRRQAVEQVMAVCRRASLKLHSIDIAEMALRNVIELRGLDHRGAAIVRLLPGGGNVALIRQGQLFMSRQFDIAYGGGLLDEIPAEQLILELQRSLDYYERQMGQVPPAHIYLCGENIGPEKISEALTNGLSAELSALELEELLREPLNYESGVLQLCVGAIGGACRRSAA